MLSTLSSNQGDGEVVLSSYILANRRSYHLALGVGADPPVKNPWMIEGQATQFPALVVWKRGAIN